VKKEISSTKKVKWFLDAPEESVCLFEKKINTSELDKPPGIEETTET